MKLRWFPCLCLIALVAPAPLLAGEKSKEAPPSVVLRVRSLDTLLTHARTIVALSGREEIARQVEGLIKAKVGPNGLEGIDNTKPFGFYARMGEQIDDVRGAVLLPISDQKAFLGLLENLNMPATKGKDDIYNVQLKVKGANLEGYFRFAHGYLYATALNASMLKDVPTPDQVLGKDSSALALSLRLDQLPQAAKLLLLDQLEQLLDETKKDKQPGETAAQQAFRLACLKEFGDFAHTFFKEGAEIKAILDIHEKTNQFSAKVSLTGLPGSGLARDLEKLGQAKSPLAGLLTQGDAGRIAIHAELPKGVKEALDKVIDDGAAESLKALQEEEKKNQAKTLIDALMPSFKQGVLDFAMAVRGPSADNQFSAIAGVGIKDGIKLGKTTRDLVQDALKQIPEGLKELIQLDMDSVGDVKIHRFEVPGTPVDFLGNPFQLHLAFRDDALLLATGKDGLKLLKEAVAAKSAAKAPLLLYQADLGRLMRAAPKQVRGDLMPMLEKAFPPGKDNTMRLQLEGGTALTFSVEAPLSLIQYFSAVRDLEKKE